MLEDEDSPVEWSEEDVVFLHWRLLREVSQLAAPATPLEETFDTLRRVFAEREKYGMPFSFVSFLRVVGCSPLSPIAYCGRVAHRHRGKYGRPRLTADLRAACFAINPKRVRRLMLREGLCAQRRRRFVRTTDSRHRFAVAPNLFGQRFEAEAPDRIWLADITYVGTDEGWLFVVLVMVRLPPKNGRHEVEL
ncbi:IS3 family transposase [Aromatoleum bremense]|uniref:IS3 family transposase n=1 Tax=Aromatoleum bremense TaxID=76115 RepID=UPI001AEBCB28|nr:IS3 family transposase [Aromatoleum bremense]